MYVAVNVNYVPPWSDTRHLFDTLEKNKRARIKTLFRRGLNIISPGTNFFLRFEGSELTIFSPCFEIKARCSTPLLLKSVKTGEISNHPTSYLPPPSCRGLQCMLCEVIRAFCGVLRTFSYMFCVRYPDNRSQEFDKNENNQYPGIR
jgi:hypothetical protein